MRSVLYVEVDLLAKIILIFVGMVGAGLYLVR